MSSVIFCRISRYQNSPATEVGLGWSPILVGEPVAKTYYTVFKVVRKAEEDSKDSNKSVMERCLKEENFDSKSAAGEERTLFIV